jgi:hypothetical protein
MAKMIAEVSENLNEKFYLCFKNIIFNADRSDENSCSSNKPPCPPHMSKCVADQQCIPDYFVCDFEKGSLS